MNPVNTNPIEAAWVILSLIGFMSALMLTGAWLARLRALYRLDVDRETKYIAMDRLRHKVGNSIVFGLSLYLGLLATLSPEHPSQATGDIEQWAYSAQVAVALPIFFIIIGIPAVLMFWSAVLDWVVDKSIGSK